ncbi:MAG: hypothetical protein HRU33_09790 [Rhodobacteraceae bacterium]|nr:hypothetical protein [Paracoccaceae bacterium]
MPFDFKRCSFLLQLSGIIFGLVEADSDLAFQSPHVNLGCEKFYFEQADISVAASTLMFGVFQQRLINYIKAIETMAAVRDLPPFRSNHSKLTYARIFARHQVFGLCLA